MCTLTKRRARAVAFLSLAGIVALLAPSKAFAADATIEQPTFSPPAQSFTAPVQTGKARRAAVDRPGLYQVPAGNAKLYCAGRAMPLLDTGMVFLRGIDDFYEGAGAVWAGDLRIEGDAGEIPPPTPQAHLDAAKKFVAVYRLEQDEDFQHNYLKGCAPNWYFAPASNIIGARKNEAGERIANSVSLSIAISQPLPKEHAELRIALNSDAPPEKDNTLAVRINGVDVLAGLSWKGSGYRIIHVPLESTLLRDGANVVELTGDTNYVKHLDWIEIETPALPALREGGLVLDARADATLALPGAKYAVDITDFGKETLATKDKNGFQLKAGRRYFFAEKVLPLQFGAEENIVPPVTGAVDYLAVGMREDLSALTPLLNKKKADGLTVKAVAFEHVMNVYNGGMYGPGALQAFFEKTHPKYVLIAGGFDRDCRRKQKNHRENAGWQRGIPAYLRQLEQLTVTDDPYTLDATIKVGRVPLNDATSLGAWAAKAAAYTPSDTAVLLAGSNKDYDFAGSQERQAPGGHAAVIKAEGRPAEDVRKELFATIQAGARLAIYQGHAQSWEIDKGLLNGSHAAAIPTSSWVLATCNSGYYQADFDVYLRDWLRAPSSGCVNAIASASIGTAGNQDQLVRQLLYFLSTQPDADWGAAMLHLKRNLPFNETTMRDPNVPAFVSKSIAEDRLTIDAYSLFGDPAARVLAPEARTAKFAQSKDAESDAPRVTLAGKWDPAMLAGGSFALEWRPRGDAQWHGFDLPAPLAPGENTVNFTSQTTGSDGGLFELQLVQRQPGLPSITWARTMCQFESVQPGVPKVMLRQAPSGKDAKEPKAPAVVLIARNEAVVHRKNPVETQFEVREKGKTGAPLLQTEWLREARKRFETAVPAGQLEGRARWRTKAAEGGWSEWFGVIEENETKGATP